MDRFAAFSARKEAKYVSFYRKNGSMTQIQRSFHTKYLETLPALNTILIWYTPLESMGQLKMHRHLGDLQHRLTKSQGC